MNKRQSSTTAEGIAVIRALESQKPAGERICYDPFARVFVSKILWLLSKLFVETGYAEKRGPGVMGFIVARERFIDDFLKAHLGEGIEQVVILGAGFDSRAYRFEELKKMRVFEVDHPATQATKQQRLKKAIDPLPPHVSFVGVDFNTQDLGQRLAECGYKESVRTIFIWQGVIHYLSREGVDATLAFIANHSAPGSALVFDYMYLSYMHDTGHGEVARMKRAAHFTGEGLTFGIEEGQVEPFLAKRGFTGVRNITAADLKRMYFTGLNTERELAPGYAIATARVRQKTGEEN